MAKNKHVVKNGNKWSVKDDGKVVSNHQTQAAAIESGKRAAKKDKVDLVIHGRDGKIRSKDSYGNDPNPPKDKEH
jgi:hypothetical protein